MAGMSELLTVGQAATLAGVSVRTMRRRVAAGEVMTAGHGQARRIVAASVVAAPPPGDPATGGQADGTPASVTPAMTEDVTEVRADVTADSPAAGTPAMAVLVALVDRLTSENRDLGRQLVDVTAAATLWQERARVLADQLALAAPAPSDGLGAGHRTPEPSDPTTEPPSPFPWSLSPRPNVRARAPWLVVLAILLAAVVVGWWPR
jgi:hypothetical protein